MIGSGRAGGADKRGYIGAFTALLALLVAVAAAVASRSGGLTGGVERLAFGSSALLNGLTSGLPLRYYAFGAGMLAAFNPCGFALLPAYLGFYLGDVPGGAGAHARLPRVVARAVWIGLVVTAGFVVLFGAVTGVLLGVVGSTLGRLFPLVGLLVGVALIAMAGRMLSGRPLYFGLAERAAGSLGSSARRTNSAGYLMYGLAYGAASLGCTLPIFLTVVGTSLSQGNFPSAAYQFLLYALGMGAVISALTVSVAVMKDALILRIRGVLRWVEPMSAVLLLLAGAYIVYYWLTQGGILAAIL